MPPSPRAATPQRVGGRYVVETVLGRGGMGAVYGVRDLASGHTRALKQLVLPADASRDDARAARLRFRREFHTMASLAHPRIVDVFDYGVDADTPYYTMELLDGEDLADVERIDPANACALLRDVASALAFLHARRLLHRDLAPRNVRCTSTGFAKLIDFGVLATTGACDDIAGTPPMIAPEAVRGRPLDHRYDLYGLGALAYRILTGVHAYPARTLEALELAWRQPVALPSSRVSAVPAALDDLVMALLSPDPLARPASAAEVIDRLTAIGGLDRLPEVETSRGWIASAALVGRQREVTELRRAAARAHDHAGRSVIVHAPSGLGKSRLLREAALEAQLAGLTVVRADSGAAASRGPYGVVNELASGLFAVAPEAVDAAVAVRAPILARVLAPVRSRVRPAPPLGDPAEDRMLLQREVCSFFLEVAARHPLALLVDDVQRCDEASAAVLATLAHQARDRPLLIAAALRTDEQVRAPATIASLLDGSERLRLRGLGEAEIAELCRSLFGDVAHVPRLARWMHRTAGGSPLHTTELARSLVDRGVLRYDHGLWSIPEDPEREDLPRELTAAMDARVCSLPPAARALGEALSIHGGELTLELIVLLAELHDEEAVFAALSHLEYEEVLLHAGTSWRFRHDGLREALLRNLEDARRAALHRRVGEALATLPGRNVERDAEIGWHLLHGGERQRGARFLEAAGRELYAAQSFSDCIAPLEAALEVTRAGSGSPRACLELEYMLLISGTLSDRRVALKHSDAAIDGFGYWAGVDVMARLRKVTGRHLAIALGLTWALLRWLFTPRRGPNPYEAFRTFFLAVGYSASVYSLMFDVASAEKLVRVLDPIAVFRNRVPYAVYLMTRNLLDYPRGEIGRVRRHATRILDILEHDRITPIRDVDRRTFGGGARYLLALAAVSEVDPGWSHQLDELARFDMRFYDLGAENARAIYHRMRGEEATATEIEARVEQRYVQLGSVWQVEAFMPIVASLAYAFARDMIGLRRTIDRLSRQIGDGFHFRPYLELARGEYLREHGELAEARAAIEASLTGHELALLRVAALPALAETLFAQGELDRACEVAREGLALGADPERGNLHGKLRSARALALAEAARGDREAAARRLDAAIAEAAPRGSPLLSGSLHEARARVALVADDWSGFRTHLAETERLFRRTNNTVLIGHAERLAQLGVRLSADASAALPETAKLRPPDTSLLASAVGTAPSPTGARDRIAAAIASCRGSAERAQRLLDLMLDETRAVTGYLFLEREGQMELIAPLWGEEPPRELVREVRTAAAPEGLARDLGRWRALAVRGADGALAGWLCVRGGALRLVEPDGALLAEIARQLITERAPSVAEPSSA